jgi:hypothetical protein
MRTSCHYFGTSGWYFLRDNPYWSIVVYQPPNTTIRASQSVLHPHFSIHPIVDYILEITFGIIIGWGDIELHLHYIWIQQKGKKSNFLFFCINTCKLGRFHSFLKDFMQFFYYKYWLIHIFITFTTQSSQVSFI